MAEFATYMEKSLSIYYCQMDKLNCHSATDLNLKQKEDSILPSVIGTKSEKDKSKKSIKSQSGKRTLLIRTAYSSKYLKNTH